MRRGSACGAAVAVALALALTGCGGDGPPLPKPPRAAESPARALERVRVEAERRGCRRPREIFHRVHSVRTPAQCRDGLDFLPRIADATPRRYGTAALAVYPGHGALVFALDRDRRFKVVMQIVEKNAAGRRPNERADRAADHLVNALAEGPCSQRDPVFGPGLGVCRAAGVRALAAALRGRDEGARRFGGDFDTAFYGVRVRPGRYYTLVLFATPDGEWQLADAFPVQ